MNVRIVSSLLLGMWFNGRTSAKMLKELPRNPRGLAPEDELAK